MDRGENLRFLPMTSLKGLSLPCSFSFSISFSTASSDSIPSKRLFSLISLFRLQADIENRILLNAGSALSSTTSTGLVLYALEIRILRF